MEELQKIKDQAIENKKLKARIKELEAELACYEENAE